MATTFYASPEEARTRRGRRYLYLACLREGTGVEAPDFLAVVDAERGDVVHETPMPNVGDELHHFGWNRCSSACHGPDRSHLIVPGFRSSRVHVVNVADDPRRPRMEKVIEPEEIVRETGYTRPHTVHCMPGDNIVLAMLGDADGDGAGGFAVLDAQTFEVKGRWENGGDRPPFNYDFWYQPRKNVLVSPSSASRTRTSPASTWPTSKPVATGSRIHFWNLEQRTLEQTIDLGEKGLVPLEVRWLHDPDADQGFVGAALSSVMFRFQRANGPGPRTRDRGRLGRDRRLALPGARTDHRPRPLHGRPLPLLRQLAARRRPPVRHLQPRRAEAHRPGLARRGARQAERRPARPERRPEHAAALLDGRRLYVTNSLYSTWDNQFYPELRSWLLRIDCDPKGGMEIDHGFFVDFHDRADGPARAHEVRLQNGDCTTEIFQ